MSNSLSQVANEFTQWVREEALPFWVNYGFDSRSGSAYEHVAPEGLPDFNGDKTIYVQATQMYVFSTVEHLGWSKGLQDVVKNIGNFVSRWATSECRSDGYMRRLSKDFDIVDDRLDITDHAFFILSSAANYRIYRKYSDQQRATNILDWLDLKFKHPSGGWKEGNYQTPYRKPSSHMWLMHGFLLMYEITRSEFWLDQSTRVYELFEKHFYDSRLGVVYELYDKDWKPISPGNEKPGYRQSVSPANLFEWVWILERYERYACVRTEDMSRSMMSWALKYGRDQATGLFYASVCSSGKVIDALCPCRSATAYVRASVSEYRRKKHGSEKQLAEAIKQLQDWYCFSGAGLLYSDNVDKGLTEIPQWLSAETFFYIINAAQEVHAAQKILEKRLQKAG